MKKSWFVVLAFLILGSTPLLAYTDRELQIEEGMEKIVPGMKPEQVIAIVGRPDGLTATAWEYHLYYGSTDSVVGILNEPGSAADLGQKNRLKDPNEVLGSAVRDPDVVLFVKFRDGVVWKVERGFVKQSE